VRPLPLRQLGRSDDDFKTRGYPDIQPAGMMMHGEVVDHDSELFDRAVIQLYCVQAASGKGPPIKGMSGAPVLIGSDAVGLLRYALLDEEDSTAGGTIYACHARDIIALDCHGRLNLRPPYAPPTLSAAHWARLNALVAEAFADRSADLGLVAKFTLGNEPRRRHHRRDRDWRPGEGPPVMGAETGSRNPAGPDDRHRRRAPRRWRDRDLLRFLRRRRQRAGAGRRPGERRPSGTAFALVTTKDYREVESILKGYRHDFESTLTQIDVLAKYKELHTCLHTLQKMSDAIKDALGRDAAEISVRRALNSYADDLRAMARDVRPQARGLKTEAEEIRWIDEFDACGRDIMEIAQFGGWRATEPGGHRIPTRRDPEQRGAHQRRTLHGGEIHRTGECRRHDRSSHRAGRRMVDPQKETT